MTIHQKDIDRALAGLKDFQRDTVDYVFRRMWEDESAARRFLIADEVGLGKTLVARGIIARTLEKLSRDGVGRIDVVYVCSNAAIAQQNVNRLNVLGDKHFSSATRLTLLPTQLHEMEKNRVNFVSFTPGTTFDLKSSGGVWRERVVLHHLLSRRYPKRKRHLLNILRGSVILKRFRRRVNRFSDPINETIAERFLGILGQDQELQEKIEEAFERFSRARQRVPWADRKLQYSLIGDCREILARTCVDALEPDLVILDEFQRFRDLLDGQNQAARLARSLMDYRAPEGHYVRVLLLSATPYKPLTLSSDEEDHYQDFLRTLEFLFEDPNKVARVEEYLRIFRQGIYDGGESDVRKARDGIQRLLRSVMVRTERVGRTQKKDAMLDTTLLDAPLSVNSLKHARLISEVAFQLESNDPVEYWKSAPYVLEFMKKYQLKERLEDVKGNPPRPILDVLKQNRKRSLSRRKVARYNDLGGEDGRLGVLMDEMVDKGQWKLLWMHPSLPYIQPTGPYAEVNLFTKALIFSAWNVVPDAISALCSFEVERRMISWGGNVPRYQELYDARKPLLRFAESRGRLTGMTALALMYPSVALARAVDPLRLALELGEGRAVPEPVIRSAAKREIEAILSRKTASMGSRQGPPDQRWYWAALAILDRPYPEELRRWLTGPNGWRETISRDPDEKGVRAHMELFGKVADGELDEELGPMPGDLLEVLTDLSLGSPAVCALRALHRIAPDLDPGDRPLSHAAAWVAGGFRTLYNLPETMALLRGEEEGGAYWKLTLLQGIEGNLQSVLDEYAHQLRESLGLTDHPGREVVLGVAQEMAEALSLRTARISADEIAVTRSGRLKFNRFRFRTRFALRFGDLKDDQDQTLARVGTVRAAFNSPFRPFILATTSIGQEGLDFHPYCHAVYHWNLPSNPVDMEQREGRVHRYKGHAVRKNVATKWGLKALQENARSQDPWEELFSLAEKRRPKRSNDLIPYWIYPLRGGAAVERRIPMFPLSREVGKLASLQRGLALYRLAFGQPRQEDLVAFLEKQGGRERGLPERRLQISLEPPRRKT